MNEASINNSKTRMLQNITYIGNTVMAITIHSPLLLVVSLSLLSISLRSTSATCTFPPTSLDLSPPHKVKGMFIFGSSYIDNGNNIFLQNSLLKVNYTPYGIDFPLGPTGRFTNGKNVVDLLGDELELPPFIPVFNNPETKGRKIVNGVNFASGGSGILDETGSFLGVVSLKKQVKNFEEVTLKELEEQVGCRSSKSLPNYLFVLGVGGNDYSLNYFRTTSNITLRDFTANLTTSLTVQIQKLYDLGARKFVLMSVYPIGCNPLSRADHPSNTGCVNLYNKAAHLFNRRLLLLVDNMKLRMPGSIPVYVNAYGVIREIIHKPASKGFRDATTTCCEAVLSHKGGSCKRGGSVCANRDTHVFFDGVHPTEAVNKFISKSAFASNLKTEVYPINVKQLARI